MKHYETLGVLRDASADDIRAAWRRKASEAHPDKGGTDEAMAAVNAAWAVLGDPQARAAYDKVGDVEASDSNTVEDDAAGLLALLMAERIDEKGPVGDLITGVHIALATLERNSRDAMVAASARRVQLHELRNSITTVDGAPNIAAGVIDSKIEAATEVVGLMEHAIAVADVCRTMLKAYRYTPASRGGLLGMTPTMRPVQDLGNAFLR